MDQITLKDFRCFRKEQTARLAPLTLLVGENSTGKTSFMALIRALWEASSWDGVPDFKEDPYDLGSFDEIVHYRGGRGGRSETFEAGFNAFPSGNHDRKRSASAKGQPYRFEVTFKKRGAVPGPVKMRLSHEGVSAEVRLENQSWQATCTTPRGSWDYSNIFPDRSDADYRPMWIFRSFLAYQNRRNRENDPELIESEDSEIANDSDLKLITQLFDTHVLSRNLGYQGNRPFASAPVRSKPHRTYDPARPTRDPEGDYVPMFLSNLYSQDKTKWKKLKDALDGFGQAAGLFDEISIKPLGKRDSAPFQVQVRKFDGKLKGPQRNLIDVGYGVSQVLPVITELLRHDPPHMFLLQQPEVHLHPSAQAALGSLFCHVAAPDRQLIIETHSDHLLDRVRMDIRDQPGRLKPSDVSILFFERGDLDVHIHSIRFDEVGNVLDAPPSYRRFFMEETRRSLGL